MQKCGYTCQKCRQKDNFTKQMSVYRFPKILVLHLKRFYNSYTRREKINTLVKIPESLDMTPYAPHSCKEIFLLFTFQNTNHQTKPSILFTEYLIIQVLCSEAIMWERSKLGASGMIVMIRAFLAAAPLIWIPRRLTYFSIAGLLEDNNSFNN